MNHAKPGTKLSKRELQVVSCYVECMTGTAIAKQLGISHKTVSTHKKRIAEKLGFGDYMPTTVALAHRGRAYLASLNTGQSPSAGALTPESSRAPAVSSEAA